ncbi:hypothetical protein L226DRAFT_251853 [Lentinus tigrinus ALCF2SS1-7]|uniref:uncharacterized protein n=1 Tax=Lentinus tigrinus ALCF2SS1-7 TaxID=1328758 RepID=UPI00116614F1|nr:hypothetical protein L226DRAFT_251853 [Lentinus tigrinus ALCF2SS1-7]
MLLPADGDLHFAATAVQRARPTYLRRPAANIKAPDRDVAQLWMQRMQLFLTQAGRPGRSLARDHERRASWNPSWPMRTGWLDQFLAECVKLGCTVDAVSLSPRTSTRPSPRARRAGRGTPRVTVGRGGDAFCSALQAIFRAVDVGRTGVPRIYRGTRGRPSQSVKESR